MNLRDSCRRGHCWYSAVSTEGSLLWYAQAGSPGPRHPGGAVTGPCTRVRLLPVAVNEESKVVPIEATEFPVLPRSLDGGHRPTCLFQRGKRAVG